MLQTFVDTVCIYGNDCKMSFFFMSLASVIRVLEVAAIYAALTTICGMTEMFKQLYPECG